MLKCCLVVCVKMLCVLVRFTCCLVVTFNWGSVLVLSRVVGSNYIPFFLNTHTHTYVYTGMYMCLYTYVYTTCTYS